MYCEEVQIYANMNDFVARVHLEKGKDTAYTKGRKLFEDGVMNPFLVRAETQIVPRGSVLVAVVYGPEFRDVHYVSSMMRLMEEVSLSVSFLVKECREAIGDSEKIQLLIDRR